MAWQMGSGMGLWMVFGGFLFIMFWGGVIYLVVGFFRGSQPTTATKHEDPIAIAKRRYASGEITHDEYDRIRNNLAA